MQPQTLTGQASLVTPSRKRFFIMVLLFVTVVINYLDRSNLSIAAPALTSELGIDPIHVGLIFSAVGWTYAAMQIPGGWLVDIQAEQAKVKAKFSWTDLGIVLSKRKLWGIYLGQFCLNSTRWFFLTWFPTYLVKYRGMDFIKSGLLASLPFLAAFIGVLCSGFFSDFLIRRGYTVGFARKLPIIGGLLISTSIIGANFVESTPW